MGELVTQYGFFLHKYNPDGSAGSSWHPWAGPNGELQFPIQEDSTALVLVPLWLYYRKTRDLELLRSLYSPVVVPCARFLASYRDPVTGLPAPSYDLWEERRGIHAFTVASVVAGLRAAAELASIFGDDQFAETWQRAAEDIRAAAERFLYRPELGRFVRMLTVSPNGAVHPDPTLDASLAGLFLFNVFPARDPRLTATMRAIEERLWVKTPIGGVARYEDDYYYQMSRDIERIPGNPWFICTLWLADWYIARANSPSELGRALDLLEWVARYALPSGVLAEQVHPETGEPLSVSPLSWSHGTYIHTVLRYLEREQRLAAAGWPAFLAP
jgi:GH15 family glucan-1,4-alpha-glucosidase